VVHDEIVNAPERVPWVSQVSSLFFFSSRLISINFCIVFIYKFSYSFLGPQGFPGIPGDRGLKGPVGKSGISGLAGEKGDRGQYGNKGERVSCDHFVLLHSFFFLLQTIG